jgi:hypothetical protein
MVTQAAAEEAQALDEQLSNRFIQLDPGGYFLVYLNRQAQRICVDHYSNTINAQGLACDPDTGKPLSCNGKLERRPTVSLQGRTAKELCIELFEKPKTPLATRLDHAAYLGRELMRAEIALYSNQEYIQN